MKATITLNPELPRTECQYLKWYIVYSLGGKKFAFCNAGERKSPPTAHALPQAPHGELCAHVAGDNCRFFKPKEKEK